MTDSLASFHLTFITLTQGRNFTFYTRIIQPSAKPIAFLFQGRAEPMNAAIEIKGLVTYFCDLLNISSLITSYSPEYMHMVRGIISPPH